MGGPVRALPSTLLALAAGLALSACGSSGPTCHTFTATCIAACADGSTPQFTATSQCLHIYDTVLTTEPEGFFCAPLPAPSVAATQCPGEQALAGRTWDCVSCTPFEPGEACSCPTSW